MVGYDTEDKMYCMELTYNYGLDSYKPGNGLKEFGIYVPEPSEAFKVAAEMGFPVDDGVIVGPDAYRFRVLALPEARTERFLYTLCRVADLNRTVTFYKDFLGFSDTDLPSIPGLPTKAAAISYTPATHPHGFEPVKVCFFEDGVTPVTTPWEGRHAFALKAEEVKAVYSKFKAERPELIMHDAGGEPISLQEKLGTLYIFIARDPDGYELCLVSRETMLPAVVQAVNSYDPSLLNWEVRDKRIDSIMAAGKEVDALVAENPVVVFSKAWCPFCARAKEALESVGAKMVVKELEDGNKEPLVPNPKAFQEYIAAKTNLGTSVPKVFIGGKCVGGGDDVAVLHRTGQLLNLCVASGAADAPARDESNGAVRYFANGRLTSKEDFDSGKGL